ncbi:hypothetical protein, partial [Klebsiella pneumoniae]|uniref:hypothetical protein n=1 Tax=Klebsiella pneumoniae TaxID=573 RepID=UPI001C6F7074
GMVPAIRCHRQNMKTSIINGSEVSSLPVAIQLLQGESRYASTGKADIRIRVPAMKGSQLKALLDYIRALK